MRRFVNGDETELDPAGATVLATHDRLQVRTKEGNRSALAIQVGEAVLVSYRGRQYRVERKANRSPRSVAAGSGEIRAPMPGQIVDVRVGLGDKVAKGAVLLVLEAMKTQQPFAAPFDGLVTQLPVSVGDQVSDGDLLIFITPATENSDRHE